MKENEQSIAPYLHLYLGQQAYWSIEGAKSTYHKVIDYDMLQDADYITPILKRLSDMTEEDAKEYFELPTTAEIIDVDRRESSVWFSYRDPKFAIEDGYFHSSVGISENDRLTSDQFIFLLKKGYWLFGDEAFDKGLIIDAKTIER